MTPHSRLIDALIRDPKKKKKKESTFIIIFEEEKEKVFGNGTVSLFDYPVKSGKFNSP